MSEYSGFSQLTQLLWDHKFLSDVTGCRKTEVSDQTGSTVLCDHDHDASLDNLNIYIVDEDEASGAESSDEEESSEEEESSDESSSSSDDEEEPDKDKAVPKVEEKIQPEEAAESAMSEDEKQDHNKSF